MACKPATAWFYAQTVREAGVKNFGRGIIDVNNLKDDRHFLHSANQELGKVCHLFCLHEFIDEHRCDAKINQ